MEPSVAHVAGNERPETRGASRQLAQQAVQGILVFLQFSARARCRPILSLAIGITGTRRHVSTDPRGRPFGSFDTFPTALLRIPYYAELVG